MSGGPGDGVPTERPRRLGRGLSSLLGEGSRAIPEGGVTRLGVDRLRPGRFQPRRRFDAEELEALARSIAEKGILQPLVVRPVEGGHEIVAGERRWRAAQQAGLHEVPVVVRRLEDRDALEIALVENIQRQSLSPLDEADGYRRLMDEFGHTQERLAAVVGKSRSHVANMVRLLTLPPGVQEHLAAGRLSAGHARALLAAPDPDGLAEIVVRDRLSVRETEALVQRGLAAPPPPRRRAAPDPNLRALELDLFNAIGLAAKVVERSPRSGELRIRYNSLDELDHLIARLKRWRGPASDG